MAARRDNLAPCIFHNNGNRRFFVERGRLRPNLGPVFCRLLERQLFESKGLKGQLRRPADLDIVLCTTKTEKQYTEKILEYLGIDEFTVLGRGLKTWRHICKLELIVDHIRRHPGPGLLLHLDAPDVLIIGDLHPAVEFFRADQKCDLLLGAEKNSAPGSRTTRNIKDSEVRFLSRIEQFEESNYPPPFRHLNAGCFIGRKEAMLELFTEALQSRMTWKLDSRLHHGDHMYNDDQLVLRELHRQHFPRIQIDHGNQVFQNLYATRRSEISAEPVLPGGVPLLIAWAGYLSEVMARRLRAIRFRHGRR